MICPNCHEDVQGTWHDIGIGPYEYWGQKCNESKMEFCCELCDTPLESEQSYDDYVSDMMEDNGRYRDRDE
jgi:hypothetical protein